MIITGVLIYNSENQVKIFKLDNLYNDIDSLDAKVSDYYTKYGSLPTLCEYFNNKNDFKQILQNNANKANITIDSIDDKLNPNDNGKYYVIDLSKLEALSLHYGYDEDYKKIEENGNEITGYDIEDEIYVINEESHQIYFPHGIVVDNEIYFWKNLDTEVGFIGDPTLYYTVSFNVGDAEPIEDQLIRPGEKSQKPSDPVLEDRGFLGWYYLEQGGTEDNPTYTEKEFDFDMAINQDYMIYAKYTGEAIMMARNDNTAFWQSTYRTKITNILFTKDEGKVPEESARLQTWNVRADSNCADVMAYLADDGTGNSTYKLTFYSPYTIYSNYNSSYYFKDFTKLSSIDFGNYNTSKVTTMHYMFYNCSMLTSLDVSRFDTSQVISMYGMFRYCSGLTSLDVSKFDICCVKHMEVMFDGCSKLIELDISRFDTSQVISMYGMFYNCSGLTSLDVSSFDTSNVTNMYAMFYGCSKLTELDLSKFDTSKVTTMQYMFRDCSMLTSLDVSRFDTGQVTTMYGMFYNCSGLTSLDVSKFDTSQVTTMYCMFYSCSSLTSLDVSNFNTSRVTTMYCMFWGCSNLTELDVNKFDTNKVNNMKLMFYNCNKLKIIYCSNDWSTGIVNDSTNMFRACSKLKGVILYYYTKTDINYANPDTGYFTRKPATP